MKQWTDEDLILLYYEELDADKAQALRKAMTESDDLRRRYDALCKMLDTDLHHDVPKPSRDLNRNIMARVNALYAQQNSTSSISQPDNAESWTQRLRQWLPFNQWNGIATASIALGLVVVITFYLGRSSVAPVDKPAVNTHIANTAGSFDAKTSRRILLSNVSSHMETSQRLLMRVSNGGDDLTVDIDTRRQMIDDLISFNRLYRQLAEQSNDATLAKVLEQVESVLLEINNTANNGEWKKIQRRLDETDLVYKLKVTDSRISRGAI